MSKSKRTTPAAKPAARRAGVPTEKLYYRIGEVAKLTEVKPYVLRYWESEFRWMAPQKSRSKQRLYRRKDIDTILLIKKLLYEERYTIAGARKYLRDLGVGKALEVSEQKVDHRVEYRRLREELVSIRSGLEGPAA
jgi:DNA-binding transcriptional MerR regulator